MRDISEYKLLGNYLIKLYENYGVDSIGYEQAHSLTEKLFTNDYIKVNYRLLPFEEKNSIVKNMINSGVFRTNHNNRIIPFKQVYNYDVSKNINAVYTCDKNLSFKITKQDGSVDKNVLIQQMKNIYSKDLSLNLQNEINQIMSSYKPNQKIR